MALAVASRVVLLLLGELWLAGPLAQQLPDGPYTAALDRDGQLDRLGLGDPVHYRTIMEQGYEQRPFTADRQATWAFLPAWPALWWVVDLVAPAQLGAAVVNVALFAAGCALVFLLLARRLGERTATVAVVLLVALPGAQFTVRPGPESLFLATSALALWAADTGRWWLVGPAATVAALSRPQGALVLLPLLLLALQQRRAAGATAALPSWATVLTALGAPVGALAAFGAHLWRLTGDPLASVHVQRAWDNEGALPGSAALRAAGSLLLEQRVVDYYGWNLVPLSLLALAASTALLVHAVRFRTVSWPLLAYTGASLLVLLTRSQTQAAVRYLLVVFPLLGAAAVLLVGRRALLATTVGVLLVLQVAGYLAAVQGAPWALT